MSNNSTIKKQRLDSGFKCKKWESIDLLSIFIINYGNYDYLYKYIIRIKLTYLNRITIDFKCDT